MTEQSQPASTVWLTQKTHDRLHAELEELKGPLRAEIIARISAARDEGDLKENGGYHSAKDEQGKMEGRIRQLEDMLRQATTEPAADDGRVSAGKVVTYRYQGDDETEQFLLGSRDIDDDEADVEVFSPQSPLGAALDGAAKGETVDFEAPNGKTLKIEIVDAVPFSG
ncbi:transcription elongation factor GreA [Nocardioides sp. AX2bis]|uniref:transcription elongation factor GreA n=1 Tax=Nocardioides sp. AX2bis TaxID=2653157 RepID=UPI0012F18FCD|nr:transcription elongation factor GreA [Nocardioides sp. AX2bis]VXC05520.1 Transcription elongation factor GreA [Nocardioides sp. AX2bis]